MGTAALPALLQNPVVPTVALDCSQSGSWNWQSSRFLGLLGITLSRAPEPSLRYGSSRILMEEGQQHTDMWFSSHLSVQMVLAQLAVTLPSSYPVPPLQRRRKEALEPH